MTTIAGIAAYGGKDKGIVLASDTYATAYLSEKNGRVIAVKGETNKIRIDNNGKFAIAHMGHYNEVIAGFLKSLTNPSNEEDKKLNEGLDERLRKGDFSAVRNLNLQNGMGTDGRFYDPSKHSSFLIAFVGDNPSLYNVFPMGRAEPRFWTSLGSGSDYSEKFLEVQLRKKNPTDIMIPNAIELATQAIIEANSDLYTTGLDFVVVSIEKIKEYGSRLNKLLETTRDSYIKQVISEYKE